MNETPSLRATELYVTKTDNDTHAMTPTTHLLLSSTPSSPDPSSSLSPPSLLPDSDCNGGGERDTGIAIDAVQ